MQKETQLFIRYMKEKHGINIDVESAEAGWESVILYHEEIDEDLLPNTVKEHIIPDTLFHFNPEENIR